MSCMGVFYKVVSAVSRLWLCKSVLLARFAEELWLTTRRGFVQVVSKIESVKVNKLDKPYDDVKILSAEAT
jgi:hypothetical protein